MHQQRVDFVETVIQNYVETGQILDMAETTDAQIGYLVTQDMLKNPDKYKEAPGTTWFPRLLLSARADCGARLPRGRS